MSSITPAQALQGFIYESAQNLGMKGDVILQVINDPYTFSTIVEKRIINVSNDIINSYGSRDHYYDLLIDGIPDNPELLHKYLYSLDSSQLNAWKSYYRPTLSTIEIEAGILHELGHIKLNHIHCYDEQSAQQNHKNELSADAVSCTTARTRKGRIRFEKRCIVETFLFFGPKKYQYEQKKVSRSHPSDVERLKQAFEFDQIFQLLSGSHQESHQGIPIDRVTQLNSF